VKEAKENWDSCAEGIFGEETRGLGQREGPYVTRHHRSIPCATGKKKKKKNLGKQGRPGEPNCGERKPGDITQKLRGGYRDTQRDELRQKELHTAGLDPQAEKGERGSSREDSEKFLTKGKKIAIRRHGSRKPKKETSDLLRLGPAN